MKSWQQYTDNTEKYYNAYMKIKFEDIFKDVLPFFPKGKVKALDIGSGSGRDTEALVNMGYEVIAVEPSKGMREMARMTHKNLPVLWVDDHLPALKKLIGTESSFDFILLSAVWMHLNESDRQLSLNRIASLLSPSGVFILTLRLGPDDPERFIYKISLDEALKKSNKAGMEMLYTNPVKGDGLNRSDVKWQILVLSK
ncbi:Trans-aconitate methyltransferase [Serratia proteamaculans]|uniref:class I SAM-dependent methyltransferase n=1 Tax=Serratia proteamaculans TaxID=28151 RepID=UPI00217ABE08|nr:class I SAM-dependent methyltransferase [Serratia proteamaculans]CAI2009179.1 Trans-aconitate methyltransferase [Serratia proteamaculans]